jgi:IS30 family transposase
MKQSPFKIIQTLKSNHYDVNKTAEELSIHRATVYRWINRAKTPIGYSTFIRSTNLKRKSTKPKNIKRCLSPQQEYAIVKLRENEGLDVRKIKKILDLKVSKNTIYRCLKSKGLIKDNPKYKRPRFQNSTHMHLNNTKTIGFLQMDVKYITPQLSGLPYTCFEYAVIDIYSRYKEAVILNHLNQDGSILALMEILPKLPFNPKFVQTDNGLEFQSKFVDFLSNRGLKHHFTHKRSPNENALIERSFRTDQEEFFFRLENRPKDYDHLRVLFAQYLHKYNTWRPHFGINLQTPMQVVANVVGH